MIADGSQRLGSAMASMSRRLIEFKVVTAFFSLSREAAVCILLAYWGNPQALRRIS
jgi:hypothetical protein